MLHNLHLLQESGERTRIFQVQADFVTAYVKQFED
jgi:hypothetical protein